MKTVLIGGKFNHIHPGHIWLLKKAKKLGKLVVVIAHDSHNKREYALSAKQRKKNLEALKIADKVVIGSPTSFFGVVKRYKPYVIVLGYDQKMPPGVEPYVKKLRIAIMKFRKHGSHSTRKLLQANLC